jgi:hypothetical protein
MMILLRLQTGDLPAGMRIDLTGTPTICLEFARRMIEKLARDGVQTLTAASLEVTHLGELHLWTYQPEAP